LTLFARLTQLTALSLVGEAAWLQAKLALARPPHAQRAGGNRRP
jgi:hypothetical protein